MRVLLRFQAIHWLLLAITARIAGSAYFHFNLNESLITAAPFITLSIGFLGIWINHIFKMKRFVTIRSGNQVARIKGTTLQFDLFEQKNLQHALGVDSFKAIQVSRGFFKFLKRCCPVRKLSLGNATVVKRKGKEESTRYLSLNNRFHPIPDSETQIALVGFNGKSKVEEIDKKIIYRNGGEELLSVKRWFAHPVKDVIVNPPSTPKNIDKKPIPVAAKKPVAIVAKRPVAVVAKKPVAIAAKKPVVVTAKRPEPVTVTAKRPVALATKSSGIQAKVTTKISAKKPVIVAKKKK